MPFPHIVSPAPSTPPPPGWVDAADKRIAELMPSMSAEARRSIAEAMWEDRPSDDARKTVDQLLVGDK